MQLKYYGGLITEIYILQLHQKIKGKSHMKLLVLLINTRTCNVLLIKQRSGCIFQQHFLCTTVGPDSS